jgi:hypothetical protein
MLKVLREKIKEIPKDQYHPDACNCNLCSSIKRVLALLDEHEKKLREMYNENLENHDPDWFAVLGIILGE